MLFLLRRLAICIVIIYQSNFLVQVFTLLAGGIVQFVILGQNPYLSKSDQNNQCLNEIVISLLTYCFICFTDVALNVIAKYAVGFAANALVCAHLLIGILSIFSISLKRVIFLAKGFYAKRKQTMTKVSAAKPKGEKEKSVQNPKQPVNTIQEGNV